MISKGKILAEGEATGHVHALSVSEVFELPDSTRQFDGTVENVISHQEHDSFKIPAIGARYKSAIVREYDHFTEEAKQVRD